MAKSSERLPRLEDVAERAGVSHQTVSRVVNNHPNVSKATRGKVEAAIAELGYRLNTAARSLVTRRSQIIGVLGSELSTALFVGNDQMALGVLRAFKEAGVRVPDDVSVVGVDDQPESGYFTPPLTTVRQDFEELGRRCMDIMLSSIEHGNGGQHFRSVPLRPAQLTRSRRR